jgi:hypothetical protein
LFSHFLKTCIIDNPTTLVFLLCFKTQAFRFQHGLVFRDLGPHSFGILIGQVDVGSIYIPLCD